MKDFLKWLLTTAEGRLEAYKEGGMQDGETDERKTGAFDGRKITIRSGECNGHVLADLQEIGEQSRKDDNCASETAVSRRGAADQCNFFWPGL
jgi:hypothetical protein